MTIWTTKKYFPKTHAITFLTILIFGTSCNGQVRKDLSKESKIISVGKPKLKKTQGSQQTDNVHCSLQDKKGNLWFGTTGEGVYKFDGKSFSQFTAADGLNSNMVYCMLEDKDGKIWIGTEAGICLYNGKTFAKIQIALRKNMPPNKYRNTHDVFNIIQDKSGKLWLATVDGVYIYDGKNFTPFIVKEDGPGFMSSNHNVEYILEDKAGNLWFGGRGNEGVFRYDAHLIGEVGQGKSITNLKVNEQRDLNWAWPALEDKQGNVWFSNWYGAYRYDGKSFIKIEDLSTGSVSPITRIVEDKKGNLWFGGGNRGICRYDARLNDQVGQGKSITCFTTRDGLINNDVWSILEDRTGNLWIGTRNTGLSRYDGKTFTSFSE